MAKPKYNLDKLFICLQPYLQILSQKEAERTTLSNLVRMDILDHFFPRFPIYQDPQDHSEAEKGRAATLAYGIKNPEKRNFYNWCVEISEDKTLQGYIGRFFLGDTKNGRLCRDQFTKLFIANPEKVISEMSERCAHFLDGCGIHSWPEQKKSDLRNTLINIGSETIAWLRQSSTGKNSQMFPPVEKDVNAAHYAESIRLQANEQSIAQSLAKIIATTGIIVETNPTDKYQEQEIALCNIWGWELTDTKDTWQKKFLEGTLAFNDGHYADAWACFESARHLKGLPRFSGLNEAHAFADMLCYQAHLMMTHGFGVEIPDSASEKDAQSQVLRTAYDKMQEAWNIAFEKEKEEHPDGIPRPYSARSYYEYAFYSCQMLRSEGGILSEKAKKGLKLAVQLNCIDAILLMAQLRLSGDFGCRQNVSAGIALLENDAAFLNATKQQKIRRISMLADHYAGSANTELAKHYYEESARLGNYTATVRLRKLHMESAHSQQITLGNPNGESVCLFNESISGASKSLNMTLHASLQGTLWKPHGRDDLVSLLRDNLQFLDSGRIVFSLMSADEKKNLSDTIALLRFLNDAAARQEASVRNAFIDRIDIYLLNTNEACPLLIDSAMGNLAEDIYFRVHICDPDMFAANELLTRFPTFLPCISRESGDLRSETWEGKGKSQRCKRRIVILGSGRSVEVLTKQIIASTFLADYPTELSVIGPDSDALQERFEEECPGLQPEVDRYISSCIIPSFYRHELDRLPLNRTCTDSDADLKRLQEILRSADYFVVSGADDYENLALGVKLRRNLLRHNANPDNRPYIAVRYRDHHSSWIASQVAVSSQNYTSESGWRFRYHWSEDYDLHLFGSDAAFGHASLFNHTIERQALELHKSYYGAMYAINQAAEGDFYRRSYNRDSSIASFIGVLYQCFGMGIYYRDPNTYGSEYHAALGKRYYSILHDNAAAVEKAAEIEHARWRCYCASRGWSNPDEKTLVNYLKNGSPKHHLEIGRLHPYMVGYSNLPNVRSRINHFIDEYSLDMKKLSDPCAPDREFVLKAPALLGYFPEEDSEN